MPAQVGYFLPKTDQFAGRPMQLAPAYGWRCIEFLVKCIHNLISDGLKFRQTYGSILELIDICICGN
jgi:hypothetical protein